LFFRWILGGILFALPQAAEAQTGRSLALRENIVVVGSASMGGYAEAAFNQVASTRGLRMAELRMLGSLRGAVSFCEGVGPSFPDVLALSRRMPKAMFENCLAHGIYDIVEVKIGLTAVTLASKKSDGRFGLTAKQVYRALAAEVADDKTNDFVPNPAKTWKDISPELGDTPIRFSGSPQGTATRDFFDDMVMQGGCRTDKAIRLIFQANARVEKCTRVRTDGVFIEVPEGQSRAAALMAAPPGTLGILSYSELVASGNDLLAVALNGMLPSYQTIANDEYDYTRPVLFYVKREHMIGSNGSGIVKGLQEFLLDVTSEQMVGPSGILSELGLVSLPAALRFEQRRNAQILRRFEP